MMHETSTEFWEAVKEAAHIPMRPSRFHTVIKLRRCPKCRTELQPKSHGLTCENCGHVRPFKRGKE